LILRSVTTFTVTTTHHGNAECLSSAARYQARVSADAILEKPSGSKTLPPVSTPTPSLHKGGAAVIVWAHHSPPFIRATAHMSATPMRRVTADGALLLMTPAGAVNDEVKGNERASIVLIFC